MTTASKVTRHYFFPKENETIHEVLKDLMESSIATVCRKRNIFPQRIFHSVCNHDLEILKFRREESFSKNENFENESQIPLSPLSWTGSLKTWVQEESSGARYSTQIYSKTMILDWLQNEAFTNLGDFSTTKIFLGIARNLDDKILEEYEFTFSYSQRKYESVRISLTEEAKYKDDSNVSSLEQSERYLLLQVEHCDKCYDDDDCSIKHGTSQMSTKMGKASIRTSALHQEDFNKKRLSSRSMYGKEKACKRNKCQILSDESNSDCTESNQCELLLPDHSRVYAIPYLPKSDIRPKNILLPCKIIGHRYHNGTLQYKLSFDDKTLDQNRIRKQWRNATRIQTKSEIIDKVLGEIYGRHDVDFKTVARRLGVNETLVQEVFEEMKNIDFTGESESEYQLSLSQAIMLSKDQIGTESKPCPSQNCVFYTFATSPVTVTIR